MSQAVHLLHLTDTHLPPEPGTLVQGVDPALALARVLEHALALPVTLAGCIVSGDLASDGEPAAYERLLALLAPLRDRGVPLLLGLGNHDARPAFRRAWSSAPFAFAAADGPCCGSHWIGDLRVLMLDSCLAGDVRGALGNDQLAWLDAELATPAPGGDVLVVHHPVTPPGVPWLDDLLLADAPALLDVLRGRRLLGILSGHCHIASATHVGGTVAITTPAVAFQFTPFPLDGAKVVAGHGYSLITIRDGAMTANPVWLPAAGDAAHAAVSST